MRLAFTNIMKQNRFLQNKNTMSAHNHDDVLIRQTVGGKLQKKADKAKDELIRVAIFNTEIKGLSKEDAATKLGNAIKDALSD